MQKVWTEKKVCKNCNKEKYNNQFHKRSNRPDGLHIRCKDCFRLIDQPKRLQYVKRYAEKNREKIRKSALNKYRKSQQNTNEHKELIFKRNLKKLYGLSLEQYNSLLKQQKGLCKICRRVNTNGRRLSVDHNHITRKVRGLLCGPCNVAIGMLQDSPSRLQTVIKYLEQNDL